MTSFTDYFWGEKNNGFDVLYHNMKHGQTSSKELEDFLKESCNLEDAYAKSMGKLARTANNNFSSSQGSFGPYWQVLKALAEKLANLHTQLVHSWQDLIKDVHKYTEEQHKKHRSIKDSESSTLETVQCIQQTTSSLHKAKESYHSKRLEFERLKRENGSQKELEKAEKKYKVANDEYRALVDKYANVRNDFEKKMTESCQRFQEVEEKHLQQMKTFIDSYSKTWQSKQTLMYQVHEEFRQNSEELTVEKLIEQLISSKTTGDKPPGPIEFEEADLSSLPPPSANADSQQKDFPLLEKPSRTGDGSTPPSSPEKEIAGSQAGSILNRSPQYRTSARWFLSMKGKKEKKKKKKKDQDVKNKENEEENTQQTPEVDEEGYSIRPDNNPKQANSYSSSSDSDSDSEEERPKINVKINPISPNGNVIDNTDELIKSVGLITRPLAMNNNDPSGMKKSQSVSDSLGLSSKSSSDLLMDMDPWGPAAPSSSSSALVNFSLTSPPTNVSANRSASTTPVNTNSSNFASDGFNTSPIDLPPALPMKTRKGATTPTGALVLPGPPPGRGTTRGTLPAKATARPTGRQSPAIGSRVMDRVDSQSSLDRQFTTTSMPVGSSRGPSPLTIGMSDTIPLAVAFSECANAYFKGSEESSCKLKFTGDLMVSFPAGIVKVLTENPSPAMLSFRVKNISALEQILVNKQLVLQDHSQTTPDCCVYSFDMGQLTDHLKRQAETNKTASYFNIDILKYQVKVKPGVSSAPLQLVTYWKCEPNVTDFRLDYKYNGAAIADKLPLTNVTVIVPVSSGVTNMQAIPNGTWSAENNRAIWKLPDISEMSENGQGCVRAKFDISQPAAPSAAAVQFLCEGTTMSGIDFELVGNGYRVSLCKKRFITGKYLCEADSVKYV